MSRYNVLHQMHNRLRESMYEASLQLQYADFTAADMEHKAVEKVKLAIDFFEEYGQFKTTVVFPAIAEYEPAVVDALQQEQEESLVLLMQVKNSVAAIAKAEAPVVKQVIGSALMYAFMKFTVLNAKQTLREEKVLNGLLWRYFSDAALKQMTPGENVETSIMSGYGKCVNYVVNNGPEQHFSLQTCFSDAQVCFA